MGEERSVYPDPVARRIVKLECTQLVSCDRWRWFFEKYKKREADCFRPITFEFVDIYCDAIFDGNFLDLSIIPLYIESVSKFVYRGQYGSNGSLLVLLPYFIAL